VLSYKNRESIGILIGVLTLVLSLSPYEIFYIALLVLSFLIGYEVSKAIGSVLFYAAPLTFIFGSISSELGILCVLLISFYAGWKSWDFEYFLKSFLISIYAGYLLTYLLNIKAIDNYAIVKLIFFVWAVDVFSYYTGKKFGKTPLAPRLSPKKNVGRSYAWLFGGYYTFSSLLWTKGSLMVSPYGSLRLAWRPF